VFESTRNFEIQIPCVWSVWQVDTWSLILRRSVEVSLFHDETVNDDVLQVCTVLSQSFAVHISLRVAGNVRATAQNYALYCVLFARDV